MAKIKIKRGLYADMPVLAVGELAYCTDIKKLFVGTAEGINYEVAERQVEITWQELKDLRDTGELMPGRQYRITDYETTTVQENTQSAGHLFDIIVTADDVDKLNENARATQRDADAYFANSKLEAWKLMYCLDNDANRFAWADEVNGKGVIYQMVDEFNNDVPYDFKNIQFKRKLTDGKLDLDSGIDTWCYTFTMSDLIEDKVVDISLKQNTEYIDDEGQYRECANNVIKEAVLDYQPDGLIITQLNDNVFLNIFDYSGNNIYYGCYSNTFGINCYSNTFGNYCSSNTFGYNCFSNTFGNGCQNNTFGNSCYENTFGYNCFSNTFGDYCRSNIFDYYCRNNTFGYNCYGNTFGNGCNDNTFGNSCFSNTFGNYCRNNTFGYNCYGNTFSNDCYYNTFGNGCIYLKISDSSGTQKRYISVDSGVRGASSANQFDLYDSAILNKDYQVTFKKSASGKYLMLWATDTGTMTGKVKDSNIDITWEDIEKNDWIDMTLEEGWSAVEDYTPQYKVMPDGAIYLRGRARRGTGGSSIITIMPAGLRPSQPTDYNNSSNSGGSLVIMSINSNGSITSSVAEGITVELNYSYAI